MSSGVRALVVRPGFVKTRMTADAQAAPFATTPEVVATATVAALGGHAGDDLGAGPPAPDLRDPAASATEHLPEAPGGRPGVLLADVGIAILAAIVVLTISPGLAVASLIAIAVLIACAISFRRESRRRRRTSGPRRRTS